MRNFKPKKTNRLVPSGIRLSYPSAPDFLMCGVGGLPAVLVLIMTTVGDLLRQGKEKGCRITSHLKSKMLCSVRS